MIGDLEAALEHYGFEMDWAPNNHSDSEDDIRDDDDGRPGPELTSVLLETGFDMHHGFLDFAEFRRIVDWFHRCVFQ
jgi:hypothetical protein